VQTTGPNSPQVHMAVTRKPTPGNHFYFAKVAQKDGDMLWSAPAVLAVLWPAGRDGIRTNVLSCVATPDTLFPTSTLTPAHSR
jgi:hypothetical protein